MHSITSLMIKVAAAATMPQGGPAPGADPSQMDPSMMDPSMMAPDPIEEDNQRLTNLLNNLQLRSQLIEQQNYLAQLQHSQASAGINPRKVMNIQSNQQYSAKNPAATAATKAFNDALVEQGILSDSTPGSVLARLPEGDMKAPQKAEPNQGIAVDKPAPKY